MCAWGPETAKSTRTTLSNGPLNSALRSPLYSDGDADMDNKVITKNKEIKRELKDTEKSHLTKYQSKNKLFFHKRIFFKLKF